jgi:hypothetical protein
MPMRMTEAMAIQALQVSPGPFLLRLLHATTTTAIPASSWCRAVPEPRKTPLVRLADDDFDGAFDDQPSRYAAAA